MIGEVDEAVKILEEWLEEDPGDPIAQHMLAASTGLNVPMRASNAFVEKTFDAFAASFEAKLESLSYRAPEIVAAALADTGLAADGRFEILDIGCGTGLCGPLLRPYASRLIGIDLSAGMLALAREKDVYTDLQQCELTEFLRGRHEAFDVMVSADTLVYFGDLLELLRSRSRRTATLRVARLHARTCCRRRQYRLPTGTTRSLQPHSRIREASAHPVRTDRRGRPRGTPQ